MMAKAQRCRSTSHSLQRSLFAVLEVLPVLSRPAPPTPFATGGYTPPLLLLLPWPRPPLLDTAARRAHLPHSPRFFTPPTAPLGDPKLSALQLAPRNGFSLPGPLPLQPLGEPRLPPPPAPSFSGPPPSGCAGSLATNYRSFAVVGDDSCLRPGCTDSLSDGFDSRASYSDGSCPPVRPGCADSSASNYRPQADRRDGSCRYTGCTDSSAPNYDPAAALPGRCVSAVCGCTDPAAVNYWSQANMAARAGRGTPAVQMISADLNMAEDVSIGCFYAGCTNSADVAYDSRAGADDGGCGEAALNISVGCTLPEALTVDRAAQRMRSGSCLFTKPGPRKRRYRMRS